MTGILALLSAIGGAVVAISDLLVSHSPVSGNATATYTLHADGTITKTLGATVTALGNWITPASAGGAYYEAYVTLNSGTLTSGTTGSALSLGSDQSFNVARTTLGNKQCSIHVSIRRASDSFELDSADILLEAEKNS